jgi:hypothetical protein
MAAKPNIQKSEPRPGNPNQPAPRILSEPYAAGQNVSLAQALANSKRVVDEAK